MMKKNSILLLLTLLASVANAQTQKGGFMLGTSAGAGLGTLFSLFGDVGQVTNQASVGFGSEKFDGEKVGTSTTVGIAPNIGFFAADGLMIGVNFSIFSTSQKDEGDDEADGATLTSLQPMLRYYFNNTAKIRPYGEVRGGILSFKNRDADEGDTATLFGAKGGAAIFLNEKVSLDVFLDYSMGFDKEENDFTGVEVKSTSTLVSFGAGFSIFL